MGKRKILIVSNVQGMMVASLKNNLVEIGYEVDMVKREIRELSVVKMEYDGVLLYTDEKLSSNQQVLVYLRDLCVEANTALFIVGDQKELEDIHQVIPSNSIAHEYVRPVNIAEISANIDLFLKEHDKSIQKKILVVDDSGAMLRSVKGWLEDKYQVALANSGAMAIKYLSLNRPDLVLLDYEMPVVNGRQVLEMIRSEIDFADIPVVFLTSKNDKESVSNVVKLRPEGYLLKTMKPDEIVKYVDDFFVKQKHKQI